MLRYNEIPRNTAIFNKIDLQPDIYIKNQIMSTEQQAKPLLFVGIIFSSIHRFLSILFKTFSFDNVLTGY